MGLIPTSKDDFREEFSFFSAGSAPSSTSLLLLSSFACHIFKEASPCQNCQLLLHKLCPLTENWKRLKILKHYASVHIRLRKSIIGYVNVLVNLSLILYLTLLSYDFVTLKGFPSKVWFCICFISFPWQKKSQNSFSKLL